jgi:hypothetical protein
MTMNRFWVVGGEFHSLGFEEIVSGTEQLFGPFDSRDDAEHAWRNVSEQNRARCTVRFTIVQENLRAAA